MFSPGIYGRPSGLQLRGVLSVFESYVRCLLHISEVVAVIAPSLVRLAVEFSDETSRLTADTAKDQIACTVAGDKQVVHASPPAHAVEKSHGPNDLTKSPASLAA